MRSELAEKDVGCAMAWLRKNGCAIADFSEYPCPCCGQKKMRIMGNEKSAVLPIEICAECKERERVREELGLPQMKVSEWHKYNLLR